jgi:hypothetical protein
VPPTVTLTGTENVVEEMTVTTCRGVAVSAGLEVVEAVKKITSPLVSPCGARVVTTVGLAMELETI